MIADPDLCPPQVRHSLTRYWHEGVPVGDFLQAVLANDLMESMCRADSDNLEALPHIVAWIYQELPRSLWGSREVYLAHLTTKYNMRAVDMMIDAIKTQCKPT